jgi:hypothetical protein
MCSRQVQITSSKETDWLRIPPPMPAPEIGHKLLTLETWPNHFPRLRNHDPLSRVHLPFAPRWVCRTTERYDTVRTENVLLGAEGAQDEFARLYIVAAIRPVGVVLQANSRRAEE